MEKKVYNSIDLFKFIAAILVVAIHTHPFAETGVDYYFTCFCRLAVPFFFVATSFFFFHRPEPNIKAYTKRLGTLYLLWFILELPFVYEKFFVTFDHSLPLQILNFIRCLIFSNTWWVSWYIMACIIAVNIVYYMDKRFKVSNSTMLIFAGGGM
jgi:serine/alanine racemase